LKQPLHIWHGWAGLRGCCNTGKVAVQGAGRPPHRHGVIAKEAVAAARLRTSADDPQQAHERLLWLFRIHVTAWPKTNHVDAALKQWCVNYDSKAALVSM
jgi:hypothetical protein